MPAQVVIPPPAVLWDQVLIWPPRVALTNATTTVPEISARAGGGSSVGGGVGTQATVQITPGTGSVSGWREHPGILSPGFRQNFVGPGSPGELLFRPISLRLIYDAAAIAAGVVMPESSRFHWVRMFFDIFAGGPAPAPTLLTGIGFGIAATGASWFGAANAPLFAIVGDGLGGLQWRVQDAAAGLIESVAVPGGLFVPGAVNGLEFLVLNSAAGRNASVAVRLNGTQVVSRNWVTAPVLPRTGNNVSSGIPTLRTRIQDTGMELWVFHVEYRSGAFTNEGIPVEA